MAKKDYKNHEVWDCYLLNDQPMTCGICGARTSFEEKKNGMQEHQCLNSGCGYKFSAVDETMEPNSTDLQKN